MEPALDSVRPPEPSHHVAKDASLQPSASPQPARPADHALPETPEPETLDDIEPLEDANGHQGYAMLQFQDAQYFLNTEKIMLGRDMLAYREARYVNHLADDQIFGNALHLRPTFEEKYDVDWASIGMQDPTTPRSTDVTRIEGGHVLYLHGGKLPGHDHFSSGGSISRRHCLIYYDPDDATWYAAVLGRNGAYVDNEFFAPGTQIALQNGSHISIGGVELNFMLPNTDDDESEEPTPDRELDQGSHTGMSFDFEDGSGTRLRVGQEDDSGSDFPDQEPAFSYHRRLDRQGDPYFSDGDQSNAELDDAAEGYDDQYDSDNDGEEADEADDGDNEDDEEEDIDATPQPAMKKGRGRQQKISIKITNKNAQPADQADRKVPTKRPPKDSKPAEKSKAISKAQAAPVASIEAPNSDPDSPKNALANTAPSRDSELVNGVDVFIDGIPMGATLPPKRKGPGRPPKDGIMSKREKQQLVKAFKEEHIKGTKDPSAAVLSKMASAKGTRKSANDETGGLDSEPQKKSDEQDESEESRLPDMRIEDYTEEQLQRPTGNYHQFIWEAIQASSDGLDLQGIYSAIMRKYPYFRFRVTTNGWQSSVRHNLGPSNGFKKIEKSGKGFKWGIIPGWDPAQKKGQRKPTPPRATQPPPHSNQQYQPYPRPPQFSQPSSHGSSMYGTPNMSANQAMARGPAHNSAVPQRPLQQPPTTQRPAPHIPPGGYGPPNAHSMNHSLHHGGLQHQMPQSQHVAQQRVPPSGPATHANPPNGRAAGSLIGDRSQSQASSTPPTTSAAQAPSSRPGVAAAPQQVRYMRPSQDVIDTFVSVFTSSFKESSQITKEAAHRIVRNAVERVLNPNKQNSPVEDNEVSVMDAFKRCLAQSQPRTASFNNNASFAAQPQAGPSFGAQSQSRPLGYSSAQNNTPATAATATAGASSSGASPHATAATSTGPPVTGVSVTGGIIPSPAVASAVSAAISATLPATISAQNSALPANSGTALTTASVPSVSAVVVPGPGSVERPTIEPITPPEPLNAGRKRTIDDVDQPDLQQAAKRMETSAGT